SQKNELGSFAPTESHEIQALYVTGDLPFKLVVQNTGVTSQGGSVGIYHSQTGRPILTVGDADADGRIDVLTYAVLDAEGETVIEVVDYEADGQSDLRANFQDGHFEIWHLD